MPRSQLIRGGKISVSLSVMMCEDHWQELEWNLLVIRRGAMSASSVVNLLRGTKAASPRRPPAHRWHCLSLA